MGPFSLSGFRQRVGVVVDLGGHVFQMLLNSIVATLDLLLIDLIERKILSHDKDQLVPANFPASSWRPHLVWP